MRDWLLKLGIVITVALVIPVALFFGAGIVAALYIIAVAIVSTLS